MKTTMILVAASLLLAGVALLPAAAADDTCASLPREAQQQCYQVTKPLGNVDQCNGGDKGYEQCLAGPCNQLLPASDGTRNMGCSDAVCGSPDWNTLTPYGGADCLDMICRNVPPVFETIKVQTLGVAGLLGLGGIPGGEIAVRVLKNAGFYCETGTGTGGPGSPCQRVLWTPAGSVGADPEGIVNTGGETAWECSWGQSGLSGYNYVGTNGNEFGTATGDCGVTVAFYVVLGYDRHWYRFTDGCSA